MDPKGMVGRIYKEDHYTLLHTKHESSGLVVSEKKIFFMFFPSEAMEANDPRGGAIFFTQGA